jgi:hypothetical protein
MWSHPADPGAVPPDWDVADPTSDAGEFDLVRTSDHVVEGLDLGDLFIVYRENSIWALQLTGDSNIFRNFQVTDESGILWKDCAVETPLGHVVATRDDLILHQGSKSSYRSLLENRWRKQVASKRDPVNYKNSFLVTDVPEKEVWYCFPEVGQQYSSLALVWNWVTGQVGFRDMPNVPFADSGPIILPSP